MSSLARIDNVLNVGSIVCRVDGPTISTIVYVKGGILSSEGGVFWASEGMVCVGGWIASSIGVL